MKEELTVSDNKSTCYSIGDEQNQPIEEVLKNNFKIYLKHRDLIEDMFQIQEKQVLEPYYYLLGKGGKKIRVIMAIMISDLFEKELKQQIIQIGGLVELLHCASLVIDDIEDGSVERRGQKCTHLAYGMKASINAANLIYFLPFNKLLAVFEEAEQKQEMLGIYMKEMICCHLGQAEDILVHKLEKAEDLPPMEEYFRMTSAKTGSLLRMLVSMISVVLKIDPETVALLIDCMNFVGISFQITDDILNLTNRVTHMGKGLIAEDLHQKKFTLVVHYLRHHQRFMQLFVQNTKDQQTITEMLFIIDHSNAIQSARKIAQGYAEKAINTADLIQCPHSRANFRALLKYIVERKN